VATCSSCSSHSSSPKPLYSGENATQVSAQKLFGAYAANQAAADKLYKGKLLAVTGVIHDVGIYVGNGVMIDAPYSGAFVRYDWLASDLYGGGRP
jgi:cell wall-associated NlpC family hydrolase